MDKGNAPLGPTVYETEAPRRASGQANRHGGRSSGRLSRRRATTKSPIGGSDPELGDDEPSSSARPDRRHPCESRPGILDGPRRAARMVEQ